MRLIWYFLCLLLLAHCAKITDSARRGVSAFRNNLGSATSVTLSALIPTTINYDTELIIEFPADYTQIALSSSPSGSIACPVSLTSSSGTSCPSFTTSSNLLALQIPNSLLSGQYDIRIQRNINPSVVHSNSNIFRIRTVSQGEIIDENQYFSEFAFAGSVVSASTPLQLIGDNTIGSNSTLRFEFVANQSGVFWVRVRIPEQFQGFPSIEPVCMMNGTKMGFVVDLEDNKRWMVLPLQSFTNGSVNTLDITLVLPGFAIAATDPFFLEVMVNNTNTVFLSYTFDGIAVAIGNLSGVSFSADTLNTQRVANYSIAFTLQHQIINGQITVTLPDSKFVLSKNCTSSYNSSVCYSKAQAMIIPSVTLYAGQAISIQFLVLNPSDNTLPYTLSISTSTTFNGTQYLVDSSTLSISLSSTLTPIFQSFQLYRPLINATLNQQTSIDFRYVPQIGNQLPLSSATSSSTIYFQIPLWFRVQTQSWNDLYNNFYPFVPNCTFGSEGTYGCTYSLQVFLIKTPMAQLEQRYPMGVGVGQCDKTISVKDVIMPPIPGRYDFRVLTFKNKTAMVDAPAQQDMFTMDIPVDPFPALSVRSSSKQANDEKNVLTISFTTGISVPYQGTINLNFTLNQTTTQSAWPNQLGHTLTNGINYVRINCGIYIRSYLATTPQCYLFDMSAKGYNIIQVGNFGTLSSGDSVVLYLMDVKYCSTAGKICQVDVNTAYTISIDNPYYLNRQTVQIAPAISPFSAYQTISSDPSLQWTSWTYLCAQSSWNFTLNPLGSGPLLGDVIVFSFQTQQIYLNMNYISSPNGTTGIVYDQPNSTLYVILTLSSTPPSGLLSIQLNSMTNPFQDGSSLSPIVVFWSGQLKSAIYQLPTRTFSGNGILYVNVGILPSTTNNLIKTFSDTDMGSNVVTTLGFTVCKPVPAGGVIVVEPGSGIKYGDSCTVYDGLTGTPQGLGDSVSCAWNSGKYYITGFQKTSPMTSIQLRLKVFVNATYNLTNLKLYSFPDNTLTTPIDINSNALSTATTTSYPFGQTGFTFPPLFSFDPFVQKPTSALMNQRGQFYFVVTPKFSHSFPQSLTFNFTIAIKTTTDGRMHCRINGTLADSCVLTDYAVVFTLPQGFTMAPGGKYFITISTRGRDSSMSGDEGLTLQASGIYTMLAFAGSTATGNYEYTYMALEVLPQNFWNYWVYSINKNVNTRLYPQSGKTYYQINFGCNIPNDSKLIVNFYRTNAGTDGFEKDLGTGISNGGDFPCYLTFGNSSTVCTLYYGIYPSPTQVQISTFGSLNGYYTIYLPNMLNPNSSLSIVKVGLVATLTSSSGTTTKLYSSTYDLVNVTFGLPSPLISNVVYQNLTIHPTFSCSNVSTYCQMSVPISTGPLSNTYYDNVVFQFPQDYPIDDGYKYSTWSFCLNCSLGMARGKIITMRLWWGMPANTVVWGSMNISTPLYRSLSGNSPVTIKTLLYKDFKLMKVTYMNMTQQFTESLLTPNVTVDTSNIGAYATYNLKIKLPVNLRSSSVLLIQVPAQLNASSGICEIQDNLGNLLVTDAFACSHWNSNNSLLLTEGFGSLTQNSTINIVVKALNPATTIPVSQWKVQIFYQKQTVLDKLIAQGNGTSPTITDTSVTKTYWDTQFVAQNDLIAGQRGILTFVIKQSSGIKSISFPSGSITLPQNAQPLCLVTTNIHPQQPYQTSTRTYPLQCSFTSTQITVPQVTPSPAPTTKLIITTLNDNNGIMFSTPGTHNFTVLTYSGLTSTVAVTIVKTNFAKFTTNTLVTNPRAKTLISVAFTPKSSASSFRMLFPMTDPYNMSRPMYSPDIGTGLQNGSQASCFGRVGFAVDMLSCTLVTGDIDTGYAAIVVSSAISAGTNYRFQVDSIITPAIFGNDYTSVHHILQSYSSSGATGTLLDRSMYYDYTIRNIGYSYQSLPSAPSPSTLVISDTGVSYTFSLKNYLATSSSTTDYLIIEFPQSFYNPIPQKINYNSSVSTWISTGNNWVIHTLSNSLAANSAVSVRLLDCVNSFVVDSNIVFTVYHVQNQVVVRAYTMAPMAKFIVPANVVYVAPVVPDPTTNNNIDNVTIQGLYPGIGIQILQASLQLSSPINNSFTIQMSVSSTFFNISLAYSSPNSSAVFATNTVTFTFPKSLTSNTVMLYLQGMQLTNSVSLTFKLNNSLGQQLDRLTFNYVSGNTFNLDIRTQHLARRYQAMSGNRAQMRLTVSLKNNMQRGEYMEVDTGAWGGYFAPQTAARWDAFYNDMAAEKALLNGSKIQVWAPILGVGTGTTVTLSIRGVPMKLGNGSGQATLPHKRSDGSIVASYTNYLIPLNGNLVSSTPSLYFVSSARGEPSIFKALLPLSTTLSPSTDTLKISFNTHSNYLSSSQFDPPLGSFSNLQTIDCVSQVLLTCVLQLGADYQQAPTVISLTPLSSTSFMSLSIPAISIPTNISTFLSVSMVLVRNGVNVSELVSEYVMYPTIVTLGSGSTSATISPNLVGEPGTLRVTVGASVGNSYDRFVLKYGNSLVLEMPFNPNSPSLMTTVTNGVVTIYPLCKWMEIALTTSTTSGSLLQILDVKNVGWRQALSFVLVEMTAAAYRTATITLPAPSANIPISSFSATPSPILISQTETISIIIKPKNRIYAGGQIKIGLPNIGMSGSEFCSIIDGLTKAKCEVDWTALQINIYGFQQYEPVLVDSFDYANNLVNPIKLQFQATMPSTAESSLLFSISIYNDSSFSPSSLNEQQSSISSGLSIQSANILGLSLFSLNKAQQLIRGNSYGTISLNLQISTTLSFLTSDYLMFDFGDSIVSRYYDLVTDSYYPKYNYIMCHFAVNNTLIQKVKTHRCEFVNWTVLVVYVPEEFDIVAGNQYKITIESVLMNSSDIYWVKFTYRKNGVLGTQRAWQQFTINPCNFDTRVAALLTNQATSATNNTLNVLNLTLRTSATLPDSIGADLSRIVLTFPTHNQQNKSFPMSLVSGQVNTTQLIGCNGAYAGIMRPLPASSLSCYSIRADSDTWNNTPSYITIQGYSSIASSTQFNLNVGWFVNPLTSGTFADMALRIEKRTLTGEWVTLNENTVWNIIGNVLVAPTPLTSGAAFSYSSWPYVSDSFGQFQIYFTPIFDLHRDDTMVLQFSKPYAMPRPTYCSQYDSTGNNYTEGCTAISKDNLFLLGNNEQLTSGTVWHSLQWYNFTNPAYTYNQTVAACPLSIFIYSQGKLVYSSTPKNITPSKKPSYVVMQPTTHDNPANSLQLYHVGFSIVSITTYLTYIELLAPSAFTTIQSCTINKGLKRISPDSPIVCNCTRNASGWRIQIYNFDRYKGDGLIILDMVLGNPAEGWTQGWRVSSYPQKGNYDNKITENYNAQGKIWVGASPKTPLHYYVYRNVQSFEDRKATLNQWAQLWTRVIPRTSHSNSSFYLLQMPVSYDLPNSQQTQCNVTYSGHKILSSPSCTINSNRSVTVYSQSSGIPPQQCQIISTTSIDSIDNRNGFLLPPNITGTEKFSVSIFDTLSTESTQEVVSPKPYPLLPISVDSTVRQVGYPTSIIRLKFKCNTPVPAGYYPDIPIGYQGRIEVLFSTRYLDSGFYLRGGFTTNLGYSTNSTTVPCKVFSGLTGNVTCQMSFALRVSIYDYAKVVISGFDALPNNTNIQIHVLNIRYVTDIYNPGIIGVCFYQIDQSNNRIDLSQPTYTYNPATYTYKLLDIPALYQTASAVLVPHFVGAQVSLSIAYQLSKTLSTGDIIQLIFPKQFNLSDSGPMTANSGGNQMDLVLYEKTNTILLIVKAGAAGTVTINQIVDVGLVFTYAVTIKMQVIQANSVVHYIDVDVPPPNPAPFSLCLMILSDYTQSKVAVNYTFSIVPSYTVQTNSSLVINFPNLATGLSYQHLSTSNPQQICTSSLGSCTVSPNTIRIAKINSILSVGTLYTVVVSGVKNPNFSGVTPNNSFVVSISTPSGYLQLQSSIQPFRFYPLTGPNRLYLRVVGDSYFKKVTSDYTLYLQTSTLTPMWSTLLLFLPLDWSSSPLITSLSGNWGLNTLLYTPTLTTNTTHTTISLLLRFSIPGKSILSIQFSPIINPIISTTSAFSARTVYDSQVIDAVSQQVVVGFEETPPVLTIQEFGFQPQNQYENAVYWFRVRMGEQGLASGSQIVIYFPDGYVDGLADNLPLTVILNNQQLQCTTSPGKLTLTTLRDLPSNSSSLLQIFGILNPASGTYYLDVALISSNTVISYSNHQATVTTTPSSPNLYLSYMDLSSYTCSSFSDMKMCFDASVWWTENVELWVDLPEEFERAVVGGCTLNGTNVGCQVDGNMRRVVVKPGGIPAGNVCLTLKGIQNPNTVGQSHPFTLLLYSNSSKQILTKTYPNINSFSTMIFTKSKLTITVGDVGDFSPDTCSLAIPVTLERGSASQVSITGTVEGFVLYPNPIVFAPSQVYNTFYIIPTTQSPYGLSYISWTKQQAEERYGQLPQTPFKLIKNAPVGYQISLSTVLSQTPLLQTSSNITLTVPIPPSQPLKIWLSYGKLPQCISFSLNPIIFTPTGSTSLSFNYSTKSCAVSDIIQLQVDPEYSSIYSLYSQQITVQLTQPDTTPPTVINHYVFDLGRNYLQYRVMTSEPSTVRYMLTLRGTSQPTLGELMDWALRSKNTRKSAVIQTYGANQSVSTLHATYTAYDTYLVLPSLTPSTNYVLYFTAIDLSGNPSPVLSSSIKTLQQYFPAVLSLCLSTPTQPSLIQTTLVQSTTWNSTYLTLQQTTPTSYTIWFIPYPDSLRPIQAVQNIDGDRVFIEKSLSLCAGYTFSSNSYENVSLANQWIDYGVSWVSDAEVEVWAVVQQDGFVYAATGGNYPEQVLSGLTSDNFRLYQTWRQRVYAFAGANVTLRLSQLYDQSSYSIYLVSQNSATPPQLMSDSQVATVIATTSVSTYSLPQAYVFSLRPIALLLPLLLLL